MKKSILLSIPLFFGWIISEAQNVISPPSASSAMAKMIETPVDLSTGVPQISIPLYTLVGRKLSYPISIGYNPSGIKVSEVPGAVGLGWSLNAPGIITRAVRGRPDEWTNSYFQFAGSVPDDTASISDNVLFGLADGDFDMQPDLFYYSTGTQTGKFIFDNQLVPQTIPKQGVKIEFDDTSTLANAVITSYDGTKYVFIGGETCASIGFFGVSSLTYKSSWYLSKIISVDKTDTIKFNYVTGDTATEDVMKSGYLHFFYDIPEGAAAHRAENEVEETFGSKPVSVSGSKQLESIESNQGKVVFVFGTRTDQPDLKKLDEVICYRKNPLNQQLIEEKRINFTFGYFADTENDSTRLRLRRIQEYKSTSSATQPPYQFIYSTKRLPPLNSAAQDPWGYYNGATSNTTMVPATTFRSQVISTSDRSIHAAFVDGCILSEIISPLGGSTEYVFEPNRYSSANLYGPGLRVSKIVNTDPYSNITAVTNYDYINPSTGSSSGILLEDPSFTPTHLPVEDIIVHQEPGGSQDTLNYYCMLIPVHFTGVGAFGSMPLVYEYVTVYHGDDYNVSGKTTYKYTMAAAVSSVYPYYTGPDNSWKLGNPLEAKQYKVDNGTPTIVGFTNNTFTDHPTYTTIKGLNAAWTKLYIIQTPQASSVVAQNFIQESKFTYLSESKVYSYEQNSGTLSSESVQNVYYDRTDGYYLPNRVTTTTPESGVLLQKEFTYPIDYPATGVLGEMRNQNMISYPVETRSELIKGPDEYVVGYQKTDYFEWSSLGIYPEFSYRGKFASPVLKSTFLSNPSTYVQKTASINRYNDKGFPIESEQEGGIPSTAIIDQNISSPTASVTNARSNQVAYSSFESSDHGNWNVNAGSQQETRPVTLTQNGGVAPLQITTAQTVTYSYTVTQSAGPRPILTFSKIGETDIERTLIPPSGNSSVSLTAGAWTASLSFDTNVSSVSVTVTYTYTNYFSPNIVSTDAKTGLHSLSFTSTHTISKTGLDPGDYVVSYYQKNGSVSFALTGSASVLGTQTVAAGSDGWELVRKTIRITSLTESIGLTGSNIKIDELRLFPVGGLMTTTCYDEMGRIQTRTDVNLQSQFYEYDEWGRPTITRDHEKNIIQNHEYKLVNN